MDALVNQYGVMGVYLDQLGAASPSPDWTPTHNHTLGGGHYWRDGIIGIIKAVRNKVGTRLRSQSHLYHHVSTCFSA